MIKFTVSQSKYNIGPYIYIYVKMNKILLFSRIDLIVYMKGLEIPTG
jgi:hypothetical protein